MFFCLTIAVAPRGGAWIETRGLIEDGKKNSVAPRGGAWIETREGSEGLTEGL